MTLVIHNAWRLDFNLSLSSFETNIHGMRNLIDLARSSRHATSLRFLFTSTIATAQSWDAVEKGPYPEELIMDTKYAVGMGYGEAKYISERVNILSIISPLSQFDSKQLSFSDPRKKRSQCDFVQNWPNQWKFPERCMGDERLVSNDREIEFEIEYAP